MMWTVAADVLPNRSSAVPAARTGAGATLRGAPAGGRVRAGRHPAEGVRGSARAGMQGHGCGSDAAITLLEDRERLDPRYALLANKVRLLQAGTAGMTMTWAGAPALAEMLPAQRPPRSPGTPRANLGRPPSSSTTRTASARRAAAPTSSWRSRCRARNWPGSGGGRRRLPPGMDVLVLDTVDGRAGYRADTLENSTPRRRWWRRRTCARSSSWTRCVAAATCTV